MKFVLGLLLSGALAAGVAHAEQIKIPVGAQGSEASAAGLPERGTTEDQVEAHWGQPQEKHPPVGQPPIERWDYPDFSVYFETGHVVHSVINHKPLVPPSN